MVVPYNLRLIQNPFKCLRWSVLRNKSTRPGSGASGFKLLLKIFLLNFVNFEIYEKIREIVKFGSVPEYPIIFRKFKSWMIFRLIKWHQSKQTANDKMVVHSHRNIYFHVWSFQKHRSSEFSLKYFRSSRSQIFFRIIALRRATLLKRDSNSGVFRWILRKF